MKILIFISLAIFLIGLIFFIFVFHYQLKPASALGLGASTIFTVDKGNGFQEIAENLEKSHLIRSAASFKLYLLSKGWADKLKPGSYEILSNLGARQIANLLFKGPLEEAVITIPEGWTLSMIEKKLKEEGVLVEGQALSHLKIGDFQNKNSGDYFSFFEEASKNAGLEGFLFPDTYRFYKNTNVLEVAKKFLGNFEKKFSAEMKAEMEKRGLDFYKTVTMASMIEAEIPHHGDRPKVSGILWKRLKNSIPLQVDATIIYIKCEVKKLNECRNITSGDLKLVSPYNTYLKLGLPSGPISNPGLSALKAALWPEETDFWFYLSDLKTGETLFSKTLEEHNLFKAKYLR